MYVAFLLLMVGINKDVKPGQKVSKLANLCNPKEQQTKSLGYSMHSKE